MLRPVGRRRGARVAGLLGGRRCLGEELLHRRVLGQEGRRPAIALFVSKRTGECFLELTAGETNIERKCRTLADAAGLTYLGDPNFNGGDALVIRDGEIEDRYIAETGCSVFGTNDLASLTGWSGGRVDAGGDYAWNLWRPYECCARRGQTFLFSLDWIAYPP